MPPLGGDLIRLDSTPSEDDFDPLKSSGRTGAASSSYSAELLSQAQQTNPLYPFYAPRLPGQPPAAQSSADKQQDIDLLKEYGLEFGASAGGSWLHSPSNPFSNISSSAPQSQGQWATFE